MTILYYVHDPMCSWCWGFRPTWMDVINRLPTDIKIQYVLGGLAPDNDQPMPEAMRVTISNTWHTIQKEIPGIKFNFDFWTKCQPRRSTYASCRAVIAAANQNKEQDMLLAIQQAYYLQALNPSDDDTLIELSRQLDMDSLQFKSDLNSELTKEKLSNEFNLRDSLYVHSFPGLVLDQHHAIKIDYNNADNILKQIHSLL
jgi:putative protein-disulfide isomerase